MTSFVTYLFLDDYLEARTKLKEALDKDTDELQTDNEDNIGRGKRKKFARYVLFYSII